MFSIAITSELLQIKSIQKENIHNVEYVFLLTVRKLSPGPISSCHSLQSTIPAVSWLGRVCWEGKVGPGLIPVLSL